ncbi:MAG TPA: hypothetical protein VM050_04945 [Patescibacteria group bacterium]|nr:hypothetical protein [Patescibacteria group bacterium]
MKIIKTTICVIIILLALGGPFAFAERKYIGYYLQKDPPLSGYYGVKAYVNTIDQTVPSGSNFYCEWVTIILSYANGYWIQCGYNKGYDSPTSGALYWYVELMDSTTEDPEINWWYQPTANNYYTYFVEEDSTYDWKAGVFGQFIDYLDSDPFWSVDLQTFVEATTDDIVINGTDFQYLEYKGNHDWNLWDQHVSGSNSSVWWIVDASEHYEWEAFREP